MNFLERNGLQTTQTHFKDIFQNNIHRNYADTMLGWLERETDFFTAPASTKHHGAHPGGLLVHSLNVYYRLRDIAIRDMAGKEDPGEYRLSEEQEETVAVIGPGSRTAGAFLLSPCPAALYTSAAGRPKHPLPWAAHAEGRPRASLVNLPPPPLFGSFPKNKSLRGK